MKQTLIFLFLLFNLCIHSKDYYNKNLKIKFKIPEPVEGYRILVKDHTDFLKTENLLSKYISNFENDNYIEIVPFLPTDFIEKKIINKEKVIITASMGTDVLDNQVGREITFYHNKRYVTIYIVKYIDYLEGAITSEQQSDYYEKKMNVYSKDKILLELFNTIITSFKLL